MDTLIKKSAALSGLKLSDREISDFHEDFSDILSLIDTVLGFGSDTENNLCSLDFSLLRPDEPKDSNFSFNTKSVPKVIS